MVRNTHALAAGLFVVVLLVATMVAVYWLGNLERERNLYVISTRESVSGLNPESTVFYRGIDVGKVLKIYFDPDDPLTILVPIEVDKDIKLSRGVYATLKLKGVTGLTQIDLQDTGINHEWLPPGDLKENRIPMLPSLTDRLLSSGQEILAKVENLMIKFDNILSEENEMHGKSTLKNLNEATSKLIKIEEKVAATLEDLPMLADNASNTLKSIDGLVNELRTVSSGLSSVGETVGENVKALADTGTKTGQAIVTETLPKMYDLFNDFQATLLQLKRTASMLESKPQALIWGKDAAEPGPGEPGFEEGQP